MVLCLSGLGEVFNLNPDGRDSSSWGGKVVTTGPSQEWQQPDGRSFQPRSGCCVDDPLGEVHKRRGAPLKSAGRRRRVIQVGRRRSFQPLVPGARLQGEKRGKLDRSKDGGGTVTYDRDTPPTTICQAQASDKQQPRSSKGVGGPESSKVRQFL